MGDCCGDFGVDWVGYFDGGMDVVLVDWCGCVFCFYFYLVVDVVDGVFEFWVVVGVGVVCVCVVGVV